MRDGFSVGGLRVVVAGGAGSGVAAARLLVGRGARVMVSDVRPSIEAAGELRALSVDLELGGHRPASFVGADLVVVSPGVPADLPVLDDARTAGVPVIGEVELASRFLEGRIVAVTGTKGKSTTTALTGRILEAGGYRVTVGGNIGRALSAQVSETAPEVLHVVEVSSFQLELTQTFRPWIAAFLNFSADHLDRHRTREAYAAAKARIFRNQGPEDWAVVNADDPFVLELARGTRAARLPFAMAASLADGVVIEDEVIVRRSSRGREPLVPLSAIRLLGRHLLADALAAAAIGSIAGVGAARMTEAVGGFHGLEHALEPVAEISGVRFVNDSKATNIDAARQAIESFSGGLVPILGGRFKGGAWTDLRDALGRRAVAVVAIGESRDAIRETLGDLVPVHPADGLERAVRIAFGLARPGGVVLLAPACASFDMFQNYAERGRRFKEEVARLARETATGMNSE